MQKAVNRRIALVTGANQGIGREVCRQLARRNLRVVLTGRQEHAAETAAAELHEEGLDAIAAEPGAAYFETLTAPSKRLVSLTESAHEPAFEEQAKFNSAMVELVRPALA